MNSFSPGLQDEMVRLRRDLHQVPEIGLFTPLTQERILRALADLPLELSSGRSCSSVTAVLRGAAGPGPSVLLRADMDALPVVEQTGLDYSYSGPAMHACGHDLHSAMLVGAAHLLADRRDQLQGDVIFMFQPGEEGHDGAARMLEDGILDASGSRPVAAYALHVMSSGLERGVFASRPGPLLAAASSLQVTVRGAGGHGAAPHAAKDPVPAACEMVLALQTFITRTFDVFDPVVLSVGTFHAGDAHNVIPESAQFEATMRTFSHQSQARMLSESARVVRGIAAAHQLDVDVETSEVFPLTTNSPTRTAVAADLVRSMFGNDRFVELPHPLTGSEDFSRILDAVPGAMLFLGATAIGADPVTAPFNHSPGAQFAEEVMTDGAELLAELASLHVAAQPPGGLRGA